MRCRKFRLTRMRSMLDSRDAKEIGIGRTPEKFALAATSISEDSRVDGKSALAAIFEAESTTVNDERKLTEEHA